MTKDQAKELAELNVALKKGEKLAIELNKGADASVHAAPLLGRCRSAMESIECLEAERIEAEKKAAAEAKPATTATAATNPAS